MLPVGNSLLARLLYLAAVSVDESRLKHLPIETIGLKAVQLP